MDRDTIRLHERAVVLNYTTAFSYLRCFPDFTLT